MAEQPAQPSDMQPDASAAAPQDVAASQANAVEPTAEMMAEQSLGAAELAAGAIGDEVGRNERNGTATAVELPDFGRAVAASMNGEAGLGLLDDIEMNVTIELGRTRMYVEDVLRLNADSVVELDKAAGDPVDIYVNDRHIARGEVLVLNENFCVRISEIVKQPVEE